MTGLFQQHCLFRWDKIYNFYYNNNKNAHLGFCSPVCYSSIVEINEKS